MTATLASLLLLAEVTAPAHGPGTYLASIEGISVGPGEYVDSFAIDTWAVDVLAVCRLPAGWVIKSGRSAAPYGELSGEATHGVTALDQERLGPAFKGLFLLKLGEPVRADALKSKDMSLPATFSRKATIGTYGKAEKTRQQPLKASNITLVPADQCPKP